jgi:hypothetical protein
VLKLHFSWGIFMSWRHRSLIYLFFLIPFVPLHESQVPFPGGGPQQKVWLLALQGFQQLPVNPLSRPTCPSLVMLESLS